MSCFRFAVVFLSCGLLLATSLTTPARCEDALAKPADGIRLSQTQVRGTHNSYHIAPDSVADKLIRLATPKEAEAIAYTHRPLLEQFNKLGIRQIELDLYLDSQGGAFATPIGYTAAQQQKADVPPHDPEGKLKQPGIKILHSPDFDFRTTAYTLIDALITIREWSIAHPRHYPIFVLLEPSQTLSHRSHVRRTGMQSRSRHSRKKSCRRSLASAC